jgi:hypothetical protein
LVAALLCYAFLPSLMMRMRFNPLPSEKNINIFKAMCWGKLLAFLLISFSAVEAMMREGRHFATLRHARWMVCNNVV